MIDLHTEEVLSLTEAAKALPPIDGKRPHISTLWRWCRVGVRGTQLEYLRVGRRIVTSREALARFAVALAEADDRPSSAPPPRRQRQVRPRSEAARRRAIAEADRRLDEMEI